MLGCATPLRDCIPLGCCLVSVRAIVAATVLPLQGWRLRRPSPRSAYTYTPSGASPAESAHALKQSVPLAAAKSPAHGTFWPWGRQSRPHPSLRAEACALPRHPQPIRVASLRRGIPLLATLAPRRVCREPVARRRPAFGLRPRLPTPTQQAVAFLFAPPARSRLMAEPLSSLAGPSLPYWRCCGALPIREQGVNCGRRRAAGGAREDGADRRPPRWFRLLRRFPQRGLACLAILTYAWRTLRFRYGRLGRAARQPTPRCHTADFHLPQCASRYFTLVLQGCDNFHA